jgi:hypothetical protein
MRSVVRCAITILIPRIRESQLNQAVLMYDELTLLEVDLPGLIALLRRGLKDVLAGNLVLASPRLTH